MQKYYERIESGEHKKLVLGNYPGRLYWKARQYGHRSFSITVSDQTKFFQKIGFFTEQWHYLFKVVGIWNIYVDDFVYKPGKSINNTQDTNYRIFYKKKLKLKNHWDKNDGLSHNSYSNIKYLNKVNGGFNVTIFDNELNRIISVHPGKYGSYSGSGRRRSHVLVSWWHFLFSKLFKSAKKHALTHEENNKAYSLIQNLYLNILTTNNLFIRYFFVLKKYLQSWPENKVFIFIEHNFRKFNLILKKKRYIKKFKRKFILPADRITRQALLVKPYKNVVVRD